VLVRDTIPAKRLTLVRVIIDVVDGVHPPGNSELGLAVIVKSCTAKVIVAV